MADTPDTQYATDRNLAARQRLWATQEPRFDLVGWVLDLAAIGRGTRVLDVGCGNGLYLGALRERGAETVGGDLSLGMLKAAAPHPRLVNLEATGLPFGDGVFDVVLAPHMLYHVPDRTAAAHELRRVLRADGVCVATTNGARHMVELRAPIEAAAHETSPGWTLHNPSTHDFSLENGAAQLAVAFESVITVRPAGLAPARVADAAIATGYVASIADHYEHEIDRPWSEVVHAVGVAAQAAIDAQGAFTVTSDPGAFVCR